MCVTPCEQDRGRRHRNRALRCARIQRDDVLSVDIERIWQANVQVYGADKAGANGAVTERTCPGARWSA